MKKVLVGGVFDYFHFGHMRMLQRAKALGGYLIVAVQDDDFILKFKPDAKPMYNIADRIELIRELRCVDETIVFGDFGEFVKTIDFDILAVGPDQWSSGVIAARNYCTENGKMVVTLPRTEGISSTSIKQMIQDLI